MAQILGVMTQSLEVIRITTCPGYTLIKGIVLLSYMPLRAGLTEEIIERDVSPSIMGGPVPVSPQSDRCRTKCNFLQWSKWVAREMLLRVSVIIMMRV